MRNVDMFWLSNKDWVDFSGKFPRLKKDAPEEAKISYKRYVDQTTEKKN